MIISNVFTKFATGMIMLHVYVRLAHLGTIKPFQIESPRINNYKSAGSQISQKQKMIHNKNNNTGP